MIGLWLNSGADWAAWHLPGGPVGPASGWADASNVEVGQTTYPVDSEMLVTEGREGSEGRSHKEEEKEAGSGTEDGAVQGPREFLVTPLLMGLVCLISQGRFDEPMVTCSVFEDKGAGFNPIKKTSKTYGGNGKRTEIE